LNINQIFKGIYGRGWLSGIIGATIILGILLSRGSNPIGESLAFYASLSTILIAILFARNREFIQFNFITSLFSSNKTVGKIIDFVGMLVKIIAIIILMFTLPATLNRYLDNSDLLNGSIKPIEQQAEVTNIQEDNNGRTVYVTTKDKNTFGFTDDNLKVGDHIKIWLSPRSKIIFKKEIDETGN